MRLCALAVLAVLAAAHAAPPWRNTTAGELDDSPRRKLLYSYERSKRCNATEPLYFIVVSEQRSGSTWLKEMLNGHPCVFMYGELFMNSVRRKKFEQHLLSPQQYMGKNEHKPPAKHLHAVGLKAFYYTTAQPTTLRPGNVALFARVSKFMRVHHGSFIWLRRENLLDRFLSDTRAHSPGLAGHCQKVAGCDQSKVAQMTWKLDLKKMRKFLDEAAEGERGVDKMLKELKLPRLDVSYNALREGQGEWRRILEFLGFGPGDVSLLHTTLSKDIVRKHSEVISNWADVQRALMGTEHTKYLEDTR